MAVLIIFPVIFQTVMNLIMLSVGDRGGGKITKNKFEQPAYRAFHRGEMETNCLQFRSRGESFPPP